MNDTTVSLPMPLTRPSSSGFLNLLPTRRKAATSVRTVSIGDHGNDQHAADVAWLTAELCIALDVPDDLSRRIVNGARSHDIGKAFVRRELLEQAGPLSAEEREQVKLHAVHGASLLERRSRRSGVDLSIEISIALLHHERWDGNGYPNGLCGTEIPLPARIVAVADVYDALLTARAYKKAWPRALAIQFLREGRGTQFDPACADAMIELALRLPSNWKRSAKSAHERSRAFESR